ncbi:hypothetical protein ACN27G_05520 [Plantactinospora sp. WMMB334]|uniref:hypothetical protein n=1 Tax=unclassified Plantactinospora TaxID=2631981 RepID=UPI003B93A408
MWIVAIRVAAPRPVRSFVPRTLRTGHRIRLRVALRDWFPGRHDPGGDATVDLMDRWQADRRIEEQHQDGGRCTECAPRGGCLRLLAAVRRRVDRADTGTIRVGLGRLV